MKAILQDDKTYILSVEKGEELIQVLREFCQENQIEAAAFNALGAAGEVEIAWYDVKAKQYIKSVMQEDLEIVSLTGNISKLGNDYIVHGHGVFSNKEMETKAGHVNRAVISGACEVTLYRFKGTINRAYDEETGLNLIV